MAGPNAIGVALERTRLPVREVASQSDCACLGAAKADRKAVGADLGDLRPRQIPETILREAAREAEAEKCVALGRTDQPCSLLIEPDAGHHGGSVPELQHQQL